MIEEKKYTNETINDAIRALGIMLDEIMVDALNTKYSEKYANYDFDVITAFDCMLDDINRIKESKIDEELASQRYASQYDQLISMIATQMFSLNIDPESLLSGLEQ